MPVIANSIVVASPAAAAETIVGNLVGVSLRGPGVPVRLAMTVDVTIGTTGNGLTATFRRGAAVTSTLITSFGPQTVVAANRYVVEAEAWDLNTPEEANMGYVFNLTVAAATAVSTVNGIAVSATWGY